MNTILVSAIFGVVMMYCGIFIKNRGALRYIAACALAVLLGFNIAETYGFRLVSIDTTNFFAFSKFGLLFNSICIACTLIYTIISGREINKIGRYTSEAYALLFFILCGTGIVSGFSNLMMLFLGIEIISIPLYILTGFDKLNLKSNEASLKYFLMGSFSTGIMVMGIALIYGASGSFLIEQTQAGLSYMDAMGLLLLFTSMLFKVSGAPFHFWTPDVYDGAPTVFTSFMATVAKVAVFAGFIRLMEAKYQDMGSQSDHIIGVVIFLTLLFGNLTAVFQQSVKRMLAYSSIAQAGFMLFALFAINDAAKEGLLLYAAAYSLATIGIFAVLAKMDDQTYEGFNGMGKSHPLVAGVLTVLLLSLAGIPLTAGFFAKYFMLASVVKTGGNLLLVIIGVVFAAISAYYYFRVIQAMYFKEGEPALSTQPTTGFRYMLVAIAAIIVVLGVYPDALLQFLYF